MPLTVDEVGTAPGLARPWSPAAATRPAGPTACGWKTRVLPWRPNLKAGGDEAGIRRSHSSPRPGKGGVGVGRESQGGLFRDVWNQITEDHNASQGVAAPPPSN